MDLPSFEEMKRMAEERPEPIEIQFADFSKDSIDKLMRDIVMAHQEMDKVAGIPKTYFTDEAEPSKISAEALEELRTRHFHVVDKIHRDMEERMNRNMIVPGQIDARQALEAYADRFHCPRRQGEPLSAWWSRARMAIGRGNPQQGQNFILMMDVVVAAVCNQEISRATLEDSIRPAPNRYIPGPHDSFSIDASPEAMAASLRRTMSRVHQAEREALYGNAAEQAAFQREYDAQYTRKPIPEGTATKLLRKDHEVPAPTPPFGDLVIQRMKMVGGKPKETASCLHCKCDIAYGEGMPVSQEALTNHFYISTNPKEPNRCKKRCGCLACSHGAPSACLKLTIDPGKERKFVTQPNPKDPKDNLLNPKPKGFQGASSLPYDSDYDG